MPSYLTWERSRRRYIFQRRVPKYARPGFGNRTTVRVHLGNIPHAVARARAAALAAHYSAVFSTCLPSRLRRHLSPQPITATISIPLSADTARRFVATWKMRQGERFQRQLDELRAAPTSAWDALTRDLQHQHAIARDQVRRRAQGELRRALSEMTTELRVRMDGSAEAFDTLVDKFNAGRVAFLSTCVQVLSGERTIHDLYPQTSEQLPLLELWGTPAEQLAEQWHDTLVESNCRVCPKTLAKYRHIAGDLGLVLVRRPVECTTPSDLAAVRRIWASRGNGRGTIRDKIAVLGSLLRPFLAEQPFHALFASRHVGAKPYRAARLPFTRGQLQTAYAALLVPEIRREDQALFALLLVLGCRVEEAYQIKGTDFEQTDCGWIVRIADYEQSGTGQTHLKHHLSGRRLPLFRGVFPWLDAWIDQRVGVDGLAFSKGGKNRFGVRSAAASKRLNRFLRQLFPNDKRLVLQSTRNTAAKVMRQARVDPRVRQRFLGHADTTVHDRHYDPGPLLDAEDLERGSRAIADYLVRVLGGKGRPRV